MFSILLLDDEPHVLSALRRTLRGPLDDRATLETCTDPHEALTRIGEHRYDLIVSDYRMPVMDGMQFLRFARELQPMALRMVVSASTEIGGVMSAINDVGVFRYVVKPWTPEVLVEDVLAALALSAERREERRLAEEHRIQAGLLDPRAVELRRLEQLEPGLTQVDWGPNGEVLMPSLPEGLA